MRIAEGLKARHPRADFLGLTRRSTATAVCRPRCRGFDREGSVNPCRCVCSQPVNSSSRRRQATRPCSTESRDESSLGGCLGPPGRCSSANETAHGLLTEQVRPPPVIRRFGADAASSHSWIGASARVSEPGSASPERVIDAAARDRSLSCRAGSGALHDSEIAFLGLPSNGKLC